MVVRRILVIGSLWLLLATCAFAAKPLTICVEEAPQRPWTMPDVFGLAIDLLGLVQQQLGEEFGYVVRPWRRCLEELKLGAVDAVALRIAEENGGAETRIRASNNCSISINLPDGNNDNRRDIAYYYSPIFEIVIDPYSGRYEIPTPSP